MGDALGYLFCELAFKTDCRGPFAYCYRLGCWFYGLSDAGHFGLPRSPSPRVRGEGWDEGA